MKIGILIRDGLCSFVASEIWGVRVMPVFNDEKHYKEFIKNVDRPYPAHKFHLIDRKKLYYLLSKDIFSPILLMPLVKKKTLFEKILRKKAQIEYKTLII